MPEQPDNDMEILGLVPVHEEKTPIDPTTEIVRATVEQSEHVGTIADSLTEYDEDGNQTDSVLEAVNRLNTNADRIATVLESMMVFLKEKML